MIYDAAIVSALGPLVGGNIHPIMFPQRAQPVWPGIRFTQIGGTINNDACGSGTEETDDIQVQFDCVAQTYEGASALCNQVRDVMNAFSTPAAADGGPSGEWDDETKTFRFILIYTIYGSSLD